MENEHLSFGEHRHILENALSDYLVKYDLKVNRENEYGVELINPFVVIDISFRYKEFQLNIFNGKEVKNLTEIVFWKFPDYIEMIRKDPAKSLFKKTQAELADARLDFSYCLKTSFDFLNKNFPEVFDGKLYPSK